MIRLRCAIYTRKSSEEGLEQDFNSLDAQREACEAYVKSQAELGWRAIKERYDDGGISGGTLERPALKRLLQALEAKRIDIIVIYKIDRLTRSLTDFAKLAERFDELNVSFVSVTQQFNTATSMGRSSSGRSPASAFATRSGPLSRKACGWAAWCPWDTTSRSEYFALIRLRLS